MLYFSTMKKALILGVCLLGVLISIPSFLKPGTLPAYLPHPHLNLGLDLQGGSYLLLEVDMSTVIRERLASARTSVAETLRKAGVRYTELAVRGTTIALTLAGEADMPAATKALADILAEKTDAQVPRPIYDQKIEGPRLTLTLNQQALTDLSTKAVQQSLSIVRRRIDETGVNEPVVARQGTSRILVELPGVSDPDRIKRLLGSTAKMTFRLVSNQQGGAVDADSELLPYVDKSSGGPQRMAVKRVIEVDGANLTRASAGQDSRTGEWVVNFELDSIGTRRFANVSTKHVGEPFAIVLDGKIISAPVIREPILAGRGQISGNFTVNDANDLAVLLRAGALPAPLTVVEERSIGPSLGADAIRAGLYSILAGFILVVAFMVMTYGRFGGYAAIALFANLALTIASLSLLGATLTLPGIAGLLLALGMAVDANILINERAREELAKGRGVMSAVEAGFRRAYTTITDSNLTSLIKMLILFVVGTGVIKGFAITISLGIIISMFTATVLVRLFTAMWLRSAKPKKVIVGTRFRFFPDNTSIPFMRARWTGLASSAFISLVSVALLWTPGLRMGIDFAGGVVIEVRTPQPAEMGSLRSQLSNIGLGQVQVQQFGSPSDVLLRFEHPEGNPAAQQEAIRKARAAVEQIQPGSEIRRVEVVGPSVGSELFRDGMIALGLASVAMFIYITFRFQWPFAVGAVATMFLDLTKTMGFYALTGFEFNLAAIAAILTIMGFSINDKVVVYDRVRENLPRGRNIPLATLIDRSINETLSRTVGTSVALFLAIAPLALFGGPALREFALTLLFGLVLATSSSIFIAAPILLTLGEKHLRKTAEPVKGGEENVLAKSR